MEVSLAPTGSKGESRLNFETHGTHGDDETLRRLLPQHRSFTTYCSNPQAGGCAIIVQKSFLRHFQFVRPRVHQAGRLHSIMLSGRKGCFQILNIHLDPELTVARKREVIACAARVLKPPREAVAVFGGDFNFYAAGETRQYLDGRRAAGNASNNYRLDDFFCSKLPHLVEVEQEWPTHIRNRDGCPESVGRLDRIYLNLYTSTLLDLHPTSGVHGSVFGASNCSDHIPVFVGLTPNATARHGVPSWIAKHP
eukprot:9485539-Pyramimonas_sp.AAC.1